MNNFSKILIFMLILLMGSTVYLNNQQLLTETDA